MTKSTQSRYTLEFKQEAVRLVEGGQSQAAVARTLDLAEQTLFNWVKAHRQGRLNGADNKPVSVEEMELGLWEVRSTIDVGIARVLFTTAGPSMVLLHGFIKKSGKTPTVDLKLGLRRAKEVHHG